MRISVILTAVFVATAILTLYSDARAAAKEIPFVAFTADTEGHTSPCQTCPAPVALGGMDRRATLITQMRTEHPAALLLDGGNFLFGPDSDRTGGKVIVDTYSAIGYDAVNLSWRDFRQGKAQTLGVLKGAKFAVVSANLLDAVTGQPLAKPFLVKTVADQRVAVIGVSEVPAGIDFLPHLKEQLAGVRIRPPAEALAEWVPKAHAEADSVLLLYYGSAKTLNALRKQLGTTVDAVFVGGVTADQLPAETTSPPVLGCLTHGRSIATLTSGVTAASVNVTPDIVADARISAMIVPPPPRVVTLPTSSTSPATAAIAVSTAPTVSNPPTSPVVVVPPPAVVPPPPPTTPPPVTVTAIDAKRISAHQTHQPAGISSVGLTADQVNKAIDRGATYLWNDLKKNDLTGPDPHLGNDQKNPLICLALVHANAHKRFPEFDSALRRYLTEYDVKSQSGDETYEAGILCMLVEAYGDPRFLPKLRDAARYLIEAQGPNGSWSYNAQIPKEAFGGTAESVLTVSGGVPLDGQADRAAAWKRITPSKPAYDGDASNTQYAMLGLMSAARCGVQLPPELWQKALAVNKQRFSQTDGGWGYEGGSAYGSMTAAGICASTIARFELGEKNPAADEQVEYGLGWLSSHFTVTENPAEATWLYYYLYSLERVGRILDSEFIGEHEWYPAGAKFLVDAQKADGRWVGDGPEADPQLAGSFALLFLTRATQSLKMDAKRGGNGTLLTDYIAPANRIYIILDCSGSMMDEMDGTQKFDIARNAVADLVTQLPKNTQIALRVYGSKKRSIEEDADQDTQLLIPFEPLDREKFQTTLKGLRARGKTPLALSMHDAKEDLSNVGADGSPTELLLLTDGGEDTMPRQDPIKAADELATVANLRFEIIGFDIGQDDWNQQLQAIAQRAHGQYWPAARGAELGKQLRISMLGAPELFSILTPDGVVTTHGAFGETLKLPEGKYIFDTVYGGQDFKEPFWINTDRITSVTFNAANSRASNASATVAKLIEPSPPSAHAKHFCTHCGASLADGAKFCTKCGSKVE